LGWNPEHIRASVTGLIIKDGYLLQHDETFPTLKVPSDRLPFEVIHQYFQTTLGIDVRPTRPHADKRRVAVGFEPPQLVEVNQHEHEIEKNNIFILKTQTPTDSLPSGWRWVAINELNLSQSLADLLLQVVGDLQTD
jgi:hypothetical protein